MRISYVNKIIHALFSTITPSMDAGGDGNRIHVTDRKYEQTNTRLQWQKINSQIPSSTAGRESLKTTNKQFSIRGNISRGKAIQLTRGTASFDVQIFTY